MADIVICEFMAQSGVDALASDFDVRYDPDLVEDRPALLAALSDARAVVVRNRTNVDRELLEAGPNLKIVARLGVGLDNVNLPACESAHVAVRATPGANADGVAEYVVATVMMLVRGAFTSSDRICTGEWPRQQLVGREIAGQRLGLVGFGAIARRVGKLLEGLGMEIVAHDPYLDVDDPAWGQTRGLPFQELLSTCDAVSLHVPLTADTHHLIDAAAIAGMRAGAVLINTSRGGVIDETALVDALRNGRLGGAALDVFENEPVDMAAGSRFLGVPNLILTPHVAGVTEESLERIGAMTVDHVRTALAGG